MFALNSFWVCLFCFYHLQEQRLLESGSGVCVNGLQEVGELKIRFTTSLSPPRWLTEPGLQKLDCPSHPGMCRKYSGLPLPNGEEAAEQDMALPC